MRIREGKKYMSPALKVILTIALIFILGYAGIIGSLWIFALLGGVATLSFFVMAFVIWLFCIFSLWGILKLKIRRVAFGSTSVALMIVLIFAGVYHNSAIAREREIRRQIEHQMQIPGVSQRLDLWAYVPFRGSRVARLTEESTLQFERMDNLPRLDGATALFPIYAAFVQAAYPHLNFDFRDGAMLGGLHQGKLCRSLLRYGASV